MGLPVPEVTNHAPVTVAVFASAVASVSMKLAHQKFGIDFGGMEGDIQTIAVFFAFFVKPAGVA